MEEKTISDHVYDFNISFLSGRGWVLVPGFDMRQGLVLGRVQSQDQLDITYHRMSGTTLHHFHHYTGEIDTLGEPAPEEFKNDASFTLGYQDKKFVFMTASITKELEVKPACVVEPDIASFAELINGGYSANRRRHLEAMLKEDWLLGTLKPIPVESGF